MNTEQRRQFSRIHFEGSAYLQIDTDEWPCEVRDLSLKGALVTVTTPVRLATGQRCLLELRLDEDIAIRMEGDVAHIEGERIGIVCRDIDLDSITHLRRLLELNLGSADLLEREFSTLIGG